MYEEDLRMSTPPPAEVDSTPTWADFRNSVPSRLTLPVAGFEYQLQYVPMFLDNEQRGHALNVVTRAVVDTLRPEPDTTLTSLRVTTNPANDVQTHEDREDVYFYLTYPGPVYDFQIQMGPTTLRISKRRTTLQSLLLTTRLWSNVLQRLFAPVETDAPTFADARIGFHFIRLTLDWKHELTLGAHLGDEIEATNVELLEELVRLDSGPSGQTSALGSLGAVNILRGDVNLGFEKELAGRSRQLWVKYDGPWNVTHKDLDLKATYRIGDRGDSILKTDLYDFRTPFVAFYRDLVLGAFSKELFRNVEVVGR
jgi:hypothetical protein